MGYCYPNCQGELMGYANGLNRLWIGILTTMANTDEILRSATDLGKLIAKHNASIQLKDLVKRLRDDADAQRILNDYNRQVQNISEKEQDGKPIEVEEKHQLEKLRTKLIQTPILRDFQMVQMDYLDLMRRVDEAIQSPMTPPQPAAVAEDGPLPNTNP